MSEEKPALSPAQYWEWRTTISEMEVAKSDLKLSELELKLLYKEAEMVAIRATLFLKTRVESAKQTFSAAQSEYERFKGVLEKDLGLSLNNKIIDDVTFEISDVPDDSKQNEK